jgi:hypothetical protein
MLRFGLLSGLLLLMFGRLYCDVRGDLPEPQQRILRDPGTKVVYYLESDWRHIAAISSDGKLLWCCEVVSAKSGDRVYGFRFGNLQKSGRISRDYLTVSVVGLGMGGMLGTIDTKSGHFTPEEVM